MITTSFMMYNYNSGGQLICNLPAKIDDEIWWALLESFSFLNFSYLFYIQSNPIRLYDLKSTNKGLYETFVFGSNFDRIAIKLGIISICPVALSCSTLPTYSWGTKENGGKHLTSCVGQIPKNLPSGQIIGNILSYWADLHINFFFQTARSFVALMSPVEKFVIF